jgi:parallel beta-helix repeat protein
MYSEDNLIIQCNNLTAPLSIDQNNMTSFATDIIDSSNLLLGKPIYFLFNETNINSSQLVNPGQIELWDCSNSTIQNLSIINSSAGIDSAFCNNITIRNCILSGMEFPIELLGGKNNTVMYNICNFYYFGIYCYDNGSTIASNNLASGTCGMLFNCVNCLIFNNTFSNNTNSGLMGSATSENNIVCGNELLNNCYGLYVSTYCENNLFYLNKFIGNYGSPVGNSSNVPANQWDNGSVGNYWDDYQSRYPSAINNSGIWSMPYTLNNSIGIDHFPLAGGYPSNASNTTTNTSTTTTTNTSTNNKGTSSPSSSISFISLQLLGIVSLGAIGGVIVHIKKNVGLNLA